MERYAKLTDLYLGHPLGGGDGDLLTEILRLLYTPEEAGLIAAVGFDPRTMEEISGALRLREDAVTYTMRELLRKRSVYFNKPQGVVRYSLYEPFPGLMMFPLMYAIKSKAAGKLRPLLERYLRSRYGGDTNKRIVPVRAVPWGGVLPVGRGEIQPHFRVEKIVGSAGETVVSRCPYMDDTDPGPLLDRKGVKGGTTLLFDGAARFAGDAGLGAQVKGGVGSSRSDLLNIVGKGIDEGVVLITSGFAEKVEFLCCADAGSCIFLKSVKESVFPGTAINSGFAVRVAAADCTGCGTCREVCPVGAIRIGNIARIDDGRCIGCGLCVSVCPQKAMMLIKDRGVQVRLPRNRDEMMKRARR